MYCAVLLHFNTLLQLSSFQFTHSVVSDSLQPHGSQYARPPCPSPTPGVYSNSCPSSQWCHPAITFSVVPSSSCSQSLPASLVQDMLKSLKHFSNWVGNILSPLVLPWGSWGWNLSAPSWWYFWTVDPRPEDLVPKQEKKKSNISSPQDGIKEVLTVLLLLRHAPCQFFSESRLLEVIYFTFWRYLHIMLKVTFGSMVQDSLPGRTELSPMGERTLLPPREAPCLPEEGY